MSKTEITDAEWYVLANDAFMSGWGIAEGKTNTVVVPCTTEYEAARVAEYARTRRDTKWVRIVGRKPRQRPGVLYSVVNGWRKAAGVEP
jgi:hypothetical protein